jgi:hypothetical protein
MKRTAFVLVCLIFTVSAVAAQSFTVTFSTERSAQPLDGRLLLLLSTDPSHEPRMQIDDSPRSQIVFGVTVDGWQPGRPTMVDASASGYPIHSLKDVPAGDYIVQAVLNKYETFHRADGKTVKLHMDQGEGQHWNISPGNLCSKPRKITIKPGVAPIPLALTEVISPIPPKADTNYIRHIRIQSPVLTKFWGRPMEISAIVLVPEGFDDHPNARFPLMIFHDHFVDDFDNFRTTPPDPDLKPDYSERFHIKGYNRIQQEEAYKFYQQWISSDFPRFLIVKIQHANPFYDDSYAVNSANVGPYGDAIENELIPAIEKQFRGIGQGWARFVYGGSTGGWEALAVQVFYPDHYNGAFAACPDPIDFHAYTNIDLYDPESEFGKNAFFIEGAHTRISQPAMRDYEGHTFITTQEINRYELALGDNGRSGEQFDIWQAVYGPVAENGYPKPIFDKMTGEIDHNVAAYWRQHYDLEAILERDWSKLGPELAGKIHIYVGSDDTYFLNDAVYRMENFLNSTTNPAYASNLWLTRRALLERRCYAAELPLAPALQHAILAENLGPHPEDRTPRSGFNHWRY